MKYVWVILPELRLSNRRRVSNNSSPVFVPPCSNVMLRYRWRTKWAAALGSLWRVRIPFLLPPTRVVPWRGKTLIIGALQTGVHKWCAQLEYCYRSGALHLNSGFFFTVFRARKVQRIQKLQHHFLDLGLLMQLISKSESSGNVTELKLEVVFSILTFG